MDVSELLKRLDSLNEESQLIQNEIKKVTDEISNVQYEEEKAKADISLLKKKISSIHSEDNTKSIEMAVDLEPVVFKPVYI